MTLKGNSGLDSTFRLYFTTFIEGGVKPPPTSFSGEVDTGKGSS